MPPQPAPTAQVTPQQATPQQSAAEPQPPRQPEPQAVASPQQAPERDERGTILDPELRATLESVWSAPSGRDPMGHRPLSDTGEITSRGMLNHIQEPAQRMIADALARGEEVTVGGVREWATREYGRTPSENWARTQIKAARQRDTFGVDADLV
jgi:hypothetical protein